MDKQTKTAVALVISKLKEWESARQIIKYLSPTLVVRATRPVFKYSGKRKVNKGEMQFVMHIGRPNFKEREHIKRMKKNKETFPMKGVEVKFVVNK